MQASAGNLKKVSLELGGKSPNVVFDDADLEEAIPMAANAVFMRGKSDADGKFRLPYIPMKKVWLSVWITADIGRTTHSSFQRISAAADGQTGLEFETNFTLKRKD